MGDRVVHDMSMVYGERHALSADCPCGPDLDPIGVLYHFPLTDLVSRSQPAGRRQVHARRNYSTLLVLQKDATK